MTVGRHRARWGVLYGRKVEVDSRGNKIVSADLSRPFRVRMHMRMQRSNRSEIKGQLTNEVWTLFADPRTEEGELLDDVGPWSVAEFDGRMWDIAAPPAFKRGTRRTSHWEFEVRPCRGGDLRGAVSDGEGH